MTVRRLKREEIIEAAKIRSISFHYEMNVEETAKGIAEMPEERIRQNWGCFDEDGRLMACIINNDFQARFDGHLVKMGGIGGVATLPEYRYGGAVKAIFSSLLRAAREEGEVFSALYPFSHEFYRKVGYEMFLPMKEYEFPPSLTGGYKHTGWARRMEKGADIAQMKEVYEAFAAKYNLMLRRKDERYAIGDPFGAQEFTVLLGNAGGAQAYMYYRTDKTEGKNVLGVRDIAFKDAEGFRMCLGYLGRMSADYAAVRLTLPEDVPLMEMVPRPYEVKARFKQLPMARMTNVPKALELMTKPAEADFTVQVTDEFLPENSGVYRVTAGGVERTSGNADIEASEQALTLMALGALSLEEAEYRTDVKVIGNRAALAGAFTRKPLFIADYF